MNAFLGQDLRPVRPDSFDELYVGAEVEPGHQKAMVAGGHPRLIAVSKAKEMSRNFIESLIAVLCGNALYFLALPGLPEVIRHTPRALDFGLLVDFSLCFLTLAGVRAVSRRLFKLQ